MCSHSIRFFVVVKRSYQNPGINNIGLNPLPSLLQSWHTGGFDNKKCISVTCDNWQQCAKRKHHWNLYAVYLGISQIAIAPLPSLHSYWKWGTFFMVDLIKFVNAPFWRTTKHLCTLLNKSKYPFELHFSLHKCPKLSWHRFRPPKHKFMPIWTWAILLQIICSKPSSCAFSELLEKRVNVKTSLNDWNERVVLFIKSCSTL